jgi:hypothetical protein
MSPEESRSVAVIVGPNGNPISRALITAAEAGEKVAADLPDDLDDLIAEATPEELAAAERRLAQRKETVYVAGPFTVNRLALRRHHRGRRDKSEHKAFVGAHKMRLAETEADLATGRKLAAASRKAVRAARALGVTPEPSGG